MILSEIVDKIDLLDTQETIYAVEPWSPSSLAVVAIEPESGGVPSAAQIIGANYFLEVFIAKEFVQDLGQVGQRACLRLIEYAINDA